MYSVELTVSINKNKQTEPEKKGEKDTGGILRFFTGQKFQADGQTVREALIGRDLV